MPIDAVLFDYSGVMTGDFGMPPGDLPLDRDALFAEMVGGMTNEKPHPWHALERGEISLASFIADIETRVPGAGAVFATDSEHNVMANLAVRDDRVALVRSVAARGHRVGLVTNNVAEWRPLWQPKLPGDLFEFMIDSSAIGERKPDEAIYAAALEELGGIDPERVAFVDDFEWNVVGAEALGIRGVHCTSEVDLDRALDEVLAS